jgi:hypothetical protein
MNKTNRCYFSFSSRRMAFWGAHAYRVLAKAFCLHELPNRFYGLTSYEKEKFVAAKCGNQHATSVRSPRTPSSRQLYLSNE